MLTSRNLCTKSEREKNWIKQDLMKLVKVKVQLNQTVRLDFSHVQNQSKAPHDDMT